MELDADKHEGLKLLLIDVWGRRGFLEYYRGSVGEGVGVSIDMRME